MAYDEGKSVGTAFKNISKLNMMCVEGRKEGWMDGRKEGRKEEWMEGRMEGRMDGRKEGRC
jgi:hypothetical protein